MPARTEKQTGPAAETSQLRTDTAGQWGQRRRRARDSGSQMPPALLRGTRPGTLSTPSRSAGAVLRAVTAQAPVGPRKAVPAAQRLLGLPAGALCTANLCPNLKPLTVLLHNEDLKRSFIQFTVWSHKPEEKHSFKKYTFSEYFSHLFISFLIGDFSYCALSNQIWGYSRGFSH